MKVFSKYNKIRVREREDGLILIQELKFGFIWWTIFKTYHSKGALAFIEFTGKNYNPATGHYE